jgi:hypothetical protein
MEALMLDNNLEALGRLKREDMLRDAARERILYEAGVLKSPNLGGLIRSIVSAVRSFFSGSREAVEENRRDLTPCPECA